LFDGVSALANRAAELDWKGSLVSALSSHVLRRPIRNQFAVLARRDGRGNQIGCCMLSLLASGMTNAAAFPSFGQTATKSNC